MPLTTRCTRVVFLFVLSALPAAVVCGNWNSIIPVEQNVPIPLTSVRVLAGDADGVAASGDPALDGPVVVVDGDPVHGPFVITSLPAPEAGWQWGAALARFGDTLVVGTPSRATGGREAGGVTLVTRDARGTWSPMTEIIGSEPGARFGQSIDLDGERLVVGAPNATVNNLPAAGAVYVYSLNATNPTLVQIVHADPPQAGESFGSAVALDGDVLVVGGPGSNRSRVTAAGAVWRYIANGAAAFSLDVCLTSPTPTPDARLGEAVASHGDTVAAGAPDDSSVKLKAGSVLVATRQRKGTWEKAVVRDPLAPALARLGSSLVVGDDRVIAACPWNGQWPARDFRLVDGAWAMAAGCNVKGALTQVGRRVAAGDWYSVNGLAIASIDLTCGLPDPALDCNHNSIPDDCDIAVGLAADLDNDSVIDTCPIDVVPIQSKGPPFATVRVPMVTNGARSLILPWRQTFWSDIGGPPQLVDLSVAAGGNVVTTVPFDGTFSPGGSPLVLEDDWLALGGGTTGSLGLVSMYGASAGSAPRIEASVVADAPDDGFGYAITSHDASLLVSILADASGIYPIRRFDRDADGHWMESESIVLDEPGLYSGVAMDWDGQWLAVSDASPADADWNEGRVRLFELSSAAEAHEVAVLRRPLVAGATPGFFGAKLILAGDRIFVASQVGPFTFFDRPLVHLSIYRRVADGSWPLEAEIPIPFAYPLTYAIAVEGTRVLFARLSGDVATYHRAASGAWVASAPISEGTLGWSFVAAIGVLPEGSIATVIAESSGPDGLVFCRYNPVDDCNGNGVDDSVEVGLDGSDSNQNGILDECERPGDLTFDGSVDGHDLGVLLGRFGSGPGLGDCDDDGDVDGDDVSTLLADWGTT